ncbi:MAG: DNA-binding domain-containing protein [Betaproteobacteria bacterium]
MMSAYAKLQGQLQNYVLADDHSIVPAIVDGPRLDATGRLDVYANGYRLRLIEVLDADYPALRTLAGDDLFDQLATAYIKAHPSNFPNARWFGTHLPSFLATDPAFDSQPVLAEMAAFEWAMSLAFDSADDAVLDIADLVSLPGESWPAMCFTVHSSVQRLELAWNVPVFWQAVTREDELPAPERSPETAAWIVWRRELTTYFRSLESDEAVALNTICNMGNFADLCEALCTWHEPDDVPAYAMTLLKRWMGEGLISGLLQPA